MEKPSRRRIVRWNPLREVEFDVGRQRPFRRRPPADVATGVLPLIDSAEHHLGVVEAPIIQEEDAVLQPRVLTYLVGLGASSPHEQHSATQCNLLDPGPSPSDYGHPEYLERRRQRATVGSEPDDHQQFPAG